MHPERFKRGKKKKEKNENAYRDDITIFHECVGEGEGEDNFYARGGNVPVHGDVVHGIEVTQIAIHRFRC